MDRFHRCDQWLWSMACHVPSMHRVAIPARESFVLERWDFAEMMTTTTVRDDDVPHRYR